MQFIQTLQHYKKMAHSLVKPFLPKTLEELADDVTLFLQAAKAKDVSPSMKKLYLGAALETVIEGAFNAFERHNPTRAALMQWKEFVDNIVSDSKEFQEHAALAKLAQSMLKEALSAQQERLNPTWRDGISRGKIVTYFRQQFVQELCLHSADVVVYRNLYNLREALAKELGKSKTFFSYPRDFLQKLAKTKHGARPALSPQGPAATTNHL